MVEKKPLVEVDKDGFVHVPSQYTRDDVMMYMWWHIEYMNGRLKAAHKLLEQGLPNGAEVVVREMLENFESKFYLEPKCVA